MELVAEIDGLEHLREQRPAEVVQAHAESRGRAGTLVCRDRDAAKPPARDGRLESPHGAPLPFTDVPRHQLRPDPREDLRAEAVHGSRFLHQSGGGGVADGVARRKPRQGLPARC